MPKNQNHIMSYPVVDQHAQVSYQQTQTHTTGHHQHQAPGPIGQHHPVVNIPSQQGQQQANNRVAGNQYIGQHQQPPSLVQPASHNHQTNLISGSPALNVGIAQHQTTTTTTTYSPIHTSQPQPIVSGASIDGPQTNRTDIDCNMPHRPIRHTNSVGVPYQVGSGPNLPAPMRVTLPTGLILHPFRLEHDAQCISKVFHLRAATYQQLNELSRPGQNHIANVIHELQFRAYLSQPANSHHQQQQQQRHGHSLLNKQPGSMNGKQCNWPELFQVSVNGNMLHLDRSKGAHKAVNIFQFCHVGDNKLDIQVNDCYCGHEFIIELVERPQLKLFIDSCLKSRLLLVDRAIQRIKFSIQSGMTARLNKQPSQVTNEFLTLYTANTNQETGKIKISLKCPISGMRILTPARGQNCRHFQCFDLKTFLQVNCERTLWSCPICTMSIPFHMIEVDQHQLNILREIGNQSLGTDCDEILINEFGQWQTYNPAPHQQSTICQPRVSPAQPKTGPTYSAPQQAEYIQQNSNNPRTQQPLASAPGRQPELQNQSSTHWQQTPINQSVPSVTHSQPIRRPVSSMSGTPPSGPGRRSATSSPLQPGLTKKPYSGQFVQTQTTSQHHQQSPNNMTPTIVNAPSNETYYNSVESQPNSMLPQIEPIDDNLSPLAAMERTIIQHEQQMCPPPFEASVLNAPPGSANQMTGSSVGHGPKPNANQNLNSPSAATAFSPTTTLSPAANGRHNGVPASPQRSASVLTEHQGSICNSKQQTILPPTPSSGMMLHVGPETPATPSSQHCGPSSVPPVMGQSPHLATAQNNSGMSSSSIMVDHQPLSNGSGSAGSVISSSTMTPSTQSLGSVGMGGDANGGSRCGTAPLQVNGSIGYPASASNSLGGAGGSMNQLDAEFLMASGGPSSNMSHHTRDHNSPSKSSMIDSHQQQQQQSFVDENNSEILMNKLMMDSSFDGHQQNSENQDQLNCSEGDFGLAIEEAKWKQQQQHQHHQQQNFESNDTTSKEKFCTEKNKTAIEGDDKLISGGLNPSDGDDHSRGSPSDPIDRFDDFAYLDADVTDHGAGLPPDESILELFKR